MPGSKRNVHVHSVDDYIHAATRDNTRRTYQGAVEHFEVDWGGVLPTTSDTLCRYLSHYASLLSFNTLKTRLAALSQWHQSQGFVDPTKAAQVKKVLKGIRALHPAPVKKAQPLAMSVLQRIDNHLNEACRSDKRPIALRAARDRALIWVGFWRGFRSDELTRLTLQHINKSSDNALTLYLPQSKGDRLNTGRHVSLPELNALCPTPALKTWQEMLNEQEGPVFRKIDRWGAVAEHALNPRSISRILRQRLQQAGIRDAQMFSSHSLRRGFAHWAAQQHWSLSDLMTYVGWKDTRTAMAYLDSLHPTFQQVNALASTHLHR